MSGDMAAAAKIDGVARNQFAWMRMIGSPDVATEADGAVSLSGWKLEDARKTLND